MAESTENLLGSIFYIKNAETFVLKNCYFNSFNTYALEIISSLNLIVKNVTFEGISSNITQNAGIKCNYCPKVLVNNSLFKVSIFLNFFFFSHKNIKRI